jgi:hypothetical protein
MFQVELREDNITGFKDGVNVFHFDIDSEYRAMSKSSYDNCIDETGKWKTLETKIHFSITRLLEIDSHMVENLSLTETNERIGKGKTRKAEYKRVHEISFIALGQNFKGYVTDCGIIR